jgi:hypothetical protein
LRFRLRALLIVLAVGPVALAAGWWKYTAWKAEQAQQKALEAEKARIAELIELTTWRELLFDPGGPPGAETWMTKATADEDAQPVEWFDVLAALPYLSLNEVEACEDWRRHAKKHTGPALGEAGPMVPERA